MLAGKPGKTISRIGNSGESTLLNPRMIIYIDHLIGLEVDIGDLVSGPLDIRGNAGYVCRWGEKWFWEFRDGGPGWDFPKHDKSAVKFRIDWLLACFRREAR